jgi:hypothetical protein
MEAGSINLSAILPTVTYLETTHSIGFATRGVNPEQPSLIGNVVDLMEQEEP